MKQLARPLEPDPAAERQTKQDLAEAWCEEWCPEYYKICHVRGTYKGRDCRLSEDERNSR